MNTKLNLEKITISNNNYRHVIQTIPDSLQLVLMSLKPNQDIGMENHKHTTQFIKVEAGRIGASLNGIIKYVEAGQSITIPPGTDHSIWVPKNSTTPAKIYTIYTPPEHKHGLVQKIKP